MIEVKAVDVGRDGLRKIVEAHVNEGWIVAALACYENRIVEGRQWRGYTVLFTKGKE